MIRDNINLQLLNGFLLTMAHFNSDSHFRSSKPLHNRHSNSSPNLTPRKTRTRMKCIRIKRDVVCYIWLFHAPSSTTHPSNHLCFRIQIPTFRLSIHFIPFFLLAVRHPFTHSLTHSLNSTSQTLRIILICLHTRSA